MKIGWVSFFLLFALTLRCGSKEGREKKIISVGGLSVTVEVSDSPEERVRGLMYREKLNWNEGMLFVFEREDTLSFWMRNTPIPLSIAFIDKNGVIIDIQDMQPFDLTTHKSKGLALYALEMNLGWFKLNKIGVGDRVFIDLN